MADKKKTTGEGDAPQSAPPMTITITAKPQGGAVHVSADMQLANGRRYGAGQNADNGLDVMRAAKEVIELLTIQTHRIDVLDAESPNLPQPDYKPLHMGE